VVQSVFPNSTPFSFCLTNSSVTRNEVYNRALNE
jgi:hypothetical protein